MSRLTTRTEKGQAFIWCYTDQEDTKGLIEESARKNREAIEKLANYEDLEEQGKLIELPCKLGDTIWFLPMREGKLLGKIIKDKVMMIGVTSRGIHVKLRGHHEHNKTKMVGKTVFLTEEEAEAALKEKTK